MPKNKQKNLKIARYLPVLTLCLALLSSCQGGSEKIPSLREVTLKPHFAESGESVDSEFTDFEIIPLENKPECMLTDIKKLIATDSCIYVFDAAIPPRVLAFSHDGKFKSEIGSRGHAKGEYQMILNIAANSNGDTVAIIGCPDINLYSADGRYNGSLSIDNSNGVEDMIFTDRGVYLGYFHRQSQSMLSLYDAGSMKHVSDFVETPINPIGEPLGVNNGQILQTDGNNVYCLDVLNSCIYVLDKHAHSKVTRYKIDYDKMLSENEIRENPATEASRIVSYIAHDGIVRGLIEHSKGYYDFKFALHGQTIELANHMDWDYSFDCCHSNRLYRAVPANTIIEYLDKNKMYMEPVRKLLGKSLSDIAGQVAPTDNYYIIKFRVCED